MQAPTSALKRQKEGLQCCAVFQLRAKSIPDSQSKEGEAPMRKSVLLLVSLLAVASLLLAACGSPAPATQPPSAELEGTLKVWSFTNDTLVLATAFQEIHTNDKI